MKSRKLVEFLTHDPEQVMQVSLDINFLGSREQTTLETKKWASQHDLDAKVDPDHVPDPESGTMRFLIKGSPKNVRALLDDYTEGDEDWAEEIFQNGVFLQR